MFRRPGVKIAKVLGKQDPEFVMSLLRSAAATLPYTPPNDGFRYPLGFVYVMQGSSPYSEAVSSEFYKIGMSKDPSQRAKQLYRYFPGMNWSVVHTIHCFAGTDIVEAALHAVFSYRQVHETIGNEFFDLWDDELNFLYALEAVNGIQFNIALLDNAHRIQN